MLSLTFKAANHNFILLVLSTHASPDIMDLKAPPARIGSTTMIYITDMDLPTLQSVPPFQNAMNSDVSSLAFARNGGHVRKPRRHSYSTVVEASSNTPCFPMSLAEAVRSLLVPEKCDAMDFGVAFSATMQRIALQMQYKQASGGPYLDTGYQTSTNMIASLSTGSSIGYEDIKTFFREAAITLRYTNEPWTRLWDGHERRIHLDQDGVYRMTWVPTQPSLGLYPPATLPVPVYQEMPVEGANVQNGFVGNLDGFYQRSWPLEQSNLDLRQPAGELSLHQEMGDMEGMDMGSAGV